MDKTSLIIQNRLHEATVSLERAHLIYCDENWKCDYSVPPFSSIGLILQGEGVICIDKKPIHPTAGQLYLLPSNTLQTFSTSASDPYHKYFCHFEISCHETDLFELIHLPLCVDSPDPEKSEVLFCEMIDALNGNDIFSALKAKQALLNLLCPMPFSMCRIISPNRSPSRKWLRPPVIMSATSPSFSRSRWAFPLDSSFRRKNPIRLPSFSHPRICRSLRSQTLWDSVIPFIFPAFSKSRPE